MAYRTIADGFVAAVGTMPERVQLALITTRRALVENPTLSRAAWFAAWANPKATAGEAVDLLAAHTLDTDQQVFALRNERRAVPRRTLLARVAEFSDTAVAVAVETATSADAALLLNSGDPRVAAHVGDLEAKLTGMDALVRAAHLDPADHDQRVTTLLDQALTPVKGKSKVDQIQAKRWWKIIGHWYLPYHLELLDDDRLPGSAGSAFADSYRLDNATLRRLLTLGTPTDQLWTAFTVAWNATADAETFDAISAWADGNADRVRAVVGQSKLDELLSSLDRARANLGSVPDGIGSVTNPDTARRLINRCLPSDYSYRSQPKRCRVAALAELLPHTNETVARLCRMLVYLGESPEWIRRRAVRALTAAGATAEQLPQFDDDQVRPYQPAPIRPASTEATLLDDRVHYRLGTPGPAVDEIGRLLGDNADTWEFFLNRVDNWPGSVRDLIELATTMA
jgi:hypothetical protein